MKNVAMFTLGGAFCAMLLAVSAAAADKSAALSIKPAASHSTPMRSGWPPETLSGKISMVDAAEKLVVVEDASGVPFDMMITPRTHIESGDQALPFKDLTEYRNKSVSIKFVPERRGDVAESIRISG
jgi:hypothetical protein